jgi:cellulose synthase/poly-beta-1,6-N-acetylglucosamine synthase-like glycosyltransferase
MVEILFWLVVFICFYGYIGYPIIICLIALLKRCYTNFEMIAQYQPTITIIIAAHNEKKHLAEKIPTLLQQDYPTDKLTILVASDGSTDGTAKVIEDIASRQVKFLDLPRQGKAAALNTAVNQSTSDIVVFTDANNQWHKKTLIHLISPFTNQRVGGVGGDIDIKNTNKSLNLGERAYRWYECYIRLCETHTGCAVSLDGSIFAIRRALCQTVPPDVTDDFFMSTGVIEKGYDLVFQPQAIVSEPAADKAKKQYRRRIRVTVRGLQSLWKRRHLMNPVKYGMYSLALISHKLIRRLVPFFVLLLFPLSGLLIMHHTFYLVVFILQLVFYGVALVGLLDQNRKLPKVFYIAGYIFLNSIALGIGVVKFLIGERYSMWIPQQNR